MLISGGNQGIGFEIVRKLASENPSYHVLMGCRSMEKGHAAVATLHGLSVEPIQLDVTSDESISRCYKSVEQKYGLLDVLINNAGTAGRDNPTAESVRDMYTHIMSVNVISVACLTDAFIPLLKKSNNPRMIFITSHLGSLGYTLNPDVRLADYPPYKASKAAVNMITAYHAVKLKDEGFKVNACCPGLVATGLNGGMGQHASNGAINACRLAAARKDGENGTNTSKEGIIPW